MGVLHLTVLGTPEVFHNESRLTFALRKAQALLLYLAVEGGLHSRSKLAALLWPDSEPQGARTALRNALTLLRRLLADLDPSASPHSHLLSEHELLGLDPHAPLELDLDVVQQAWHQAQRLSLASSEEQRAALVSQVHHALGDASAALQVYTTCRARLAEELRVPPSAETVALAEHIRATQARQGSPPARPTSAASVPPSELVAPLVGRAAAFSQLVVR